MKTMRAGSALVDDCHYDEERSIVSMNIRRKSVDDAIKHGLKIDRREEDDVMVLWRQ